MSITPIEMVSMAPKSQEVSLHKQQEVQKPINDQIQVNNQFKNEIRHNSHQTVKTSPSDNPEYRYDAKEKGNNSYSGSNSKKKSKDKNQNTKSDNKTGSIDIRI